MGTKALSTATIRDVAQKAGVSQSTVSRVLNKTGYVSAATRARVLRAVESLDYSPSAIAVGLSKSRSRIIGVIVPQIFSPFSASFSTRRIRSQSSTITGCCCAIRMQAPSANAA